MPHRRTGVLAVKVGMMSTWDKFGYQHALTILHVDGCRVIQVKTPDKEGYAGLQVGAGTRKAKHLNKPKIGHLERWWSPPEGEDQDFRPEEPYTLLRRIQEFRISPDALLPVGTPLKASHFVPGQKIDIQGITRGKGFAGPMKRWGFKGGPASHGNSLAHRSHGSMGGTQDPGRVFKGKKMAGRMGGKNRTEQNLIIHRIDTKRDLIFVRGAVPGVRGNWVRITDAIKMHYSDSPKNRPATLGGEVPFPTIDFDTAKTLPPIMEWDDEVETIDPNILE